MNYVDRGAFGMDRAEIPVERGRPDAARVMVMLVNIQKLKRIVYECRDANLILI